MDAYLNVCLLKGLIGVGKGLIDFGLDGLGFLVQVHQLPDEDIPLLIHQLISLFCQLQGIFSL